MQLNEWALLLPETRRLCNIPGYSGYQCPSALGKGTRAGVGIDTLEKKCSIRYQRGASIPERNVKLVQPATRSGGGNNQTP